jgi:glycosyltransferase involved in cell wall biosynthesis
MGRQPWERTVRLIRGSDALVLPSRIEGLPTVLLEAMAVGTPVVATEVGGVPEMIESGKEGLLVPADDVQSLASAVVSVVSDKRLGASLAGNARRKVEETYSWDAVLPRYLEIYDRLI